MFLLQGSTQNFLKFERCMQIAHSTVMGLYLSQAVSFVNQSEKRH
jgi:hypothetical protein